jgi:glycopeptide antibiotics resistance protein
MSVIEIYHQPMQAISRIGIAATGGLAAAFLGGCIGFFVTRILVERFAVVEGPPAAVLLVLMVAVLAIVGGLLGFTLALRSLRRHASCRPLNHNE